MTTLTNSFEGGTNGTGLIGGAGGNTGGASGNFVDAVVTGVSTTIQFSNAQAAHGTLSCAVASPTGNSGWFGWSTSLGSVTKLYGRVYLYFSSLPSATIKLIACEDTGSGIAFEIGVNSSGNWIAYDSNQSVLYTSTSVISSATWVRFEWNLVSGQGNGQVTVRYYATKDSVTATESYVSGSNLQLLTACSIVFFGVIGGGTLPTTYFDDIGVSTTGYFGPIGSVSGTSSFSLQPFTFSGAGTVNTSSISMSNVVSGNVVNDYGLDSIPYTVTTTGITSALVAFIGWDVAQASYQSSGKAPAVNVTDSSGNLWRQIGISAVTPTSRCAIWIADNPRQVQWISVALTGWAYSTAYTIGELNNVPSTLSSVSVDFVQTAFNNNSVTALTVPTGTATTSDLCFAVVATGGSGGALTVPSGWIGITAIGGALPADVTTYSMWIPSQSAGSVSFIPTWSNAEPASGVIVGLKYNAPAPLQPNPNFPRVVVEAAFGATPGDWTQSVDYTWDVTGLTWTDISSRVIGDGSNGRIRVTRGRQYELSQEEAGEIEITLDNHDGALTYGNAASPYYPNVIPGVPIRVSAWWQGTQYPVAFGYVERWPQAWPEMPQWGFSTILAVDAYGPLGSTALSSAVEGDIRKDYPYAYFPTDEQYSFTSQSLDPIKAPVDANGLIAINKAFVNHRYAAYRDGYLQPVTVGQALNLLGDQDTTLGATTYAGQETSDNGPGMFYYDPNIPTNSGGNGFSIEYWFVWGNTNLFSCTYLNAWGRPSSFFVPSTAPVNGAVITVGVNTGANTAAGVGLFVNGVEVTGGAFNQNTFSPQHFVITAGPNGTACYLNGAQTSTSPTLATIPQIKAVSLGPARFAYDVSDLAVYNGFNYIAGHLAIYPQELTPTMIQNHYTSGINGWVGVPAPGRFAQVLTWGLLGLKRGGTAWFGSHGNSENTIISEAYSYEGSTGADVMAQLVTTEGGRCYVQGNGSLVYIYRWSRYNQPSSATFGDAATELPFLKESSFDLDNSFIYNQINATQNRGPNQDFFAQVTNAASQLDFFNRSGLQIQSYAMLPFDIFDVVNWSSVKYNQPVQRVQTLSVEVAAAQVSNPAMFATILGLELNAIVTTNRRPIGGAVISVTGAIQEITHEIGPTFWRTTYQIAPTFPESNALMADVPGQNTPGSSYLSW